MTTTTAASLRRGDHVTIHGRHATLTRHAVPLTGAGTLGKVRLYIEHEDGMRESVELPASRIITIVDTH